MTVCVHNYLLSLLSTANTRLSYSQIQPPPLIFIEEGRIREAGGGAGDILQLKLIGMIVVLTPYASQIS